LVDIFVAVIGVVSAVVVMSTAVKQGTRRTADAQDSGTTHGSQTRVHATTALNIINTGATPVPFSMSKYLQSQVKVIIE
jgi:hypothetical protein